MTSFDELFAAFAECTKCREYIPEIGLMPENGFRFHWKPYLRGEPPLRFVFLGWEPSWPTTWESIEEGNFSTPLQFAIREFLFANQPQTGFMITNVAQCSMKTGDLCNKTREARFRTCGEFLRSEVQLASSGTRKMQIVAIGLQPVYFLKSHPELLGTIVENPSVHRITHYSPRCTPHFRRFANDSHEEFAVFTEMMRPKYEAFIQSKEFQEHGPWYFQNTENAKRDLERLFKWKHEMAAIQAC